MDKGYLLFDGPEEGDDHNQDCDPEYHEENPERIKDILYAHDSIIS